MSKILDLLRGRSESIYVDPRDKSIDLNELDENGNPRYVIVQSKGEVVKPDPKPAPTEPAQPAGDPADVAVALRALAPLVWQVLIAAVIGYAAFTVFNLFHNHLSADVFGAGLAVVASVGITVGMFLITRTSDKHTVRGLATIYLIFWISITLCLVALEAVLGSPMLRQFVPEAFSSMGGVIAALLAAIALAPVLTLPLVAHHPDTYPSSAAAISHYIGLAAKGIGILASMFASAYFGLSRGMNPALAVLCGVVIESCFLWTYFSLIKAKQGRDVFDMVLWALALIPFGVFIAAISIETISTLASIDVPVLKSFKDVGATLYVSAIGLAMLLTITIHFLTSIIDLPMALFKRVGGAVVGNAREDIAREWKVYKDRRALPAAQGAKQRTIMAKDVPLDISEEEFIDAGEKTGILSKQQAAVLRAKVIRKDAQEDAGSDDAGPK